MKIYSESIYSIFLPCKCAAIRFHADHSVSLLQSNSSSAEQWNNLRQEERDEYKRKADEEPTRIIDLKGRLNQLAKLVFYLYSSLMLPA